MWKVLLLLKNITDSVKYFRVLQLPSAGKRSSDEPTSLLNSQHQTVEKVHLH